MSALHWFEIGVNDIERAAAFYGALYGREFKVMDLTASQGTMIVMLPARGGVGGALVYGPQHGYGPSQGGALVYLVIDGAMDAALERAVEAGGEVLLPRTPMGADAGGGSVAWISDCEGNKVGLYAAD